MRSRRDVLVAMGTVGAGLALGPVLGGCAPRQVAVVGKQAPSRGVTGVDSLKAHATARGFLTGCAVSVRALETDEAYAALVREQSSIVVAENEMKFASLRPTLTTFDFARADVLVGFAEKNGIKVRGHNLCWHRQIPKWFDAEVTAPNARQVLGEHIDTVAGRYAGRMHSWDVVNEAVMVSDGRPDGLRDSPWMKLIGPDYLEFAFRRARAADPAALLTYNDYGIEGEDAASEAKRGAVMGLLRRMKARNVPVDAVGVQAHISAGPMHHYGDGLKRFLDEAAGLGLQVFVTEMDVNDRSLAADAALRDKLVAERYKEFLDLVLSHAAVRAVLTWGITDKYTWLNGEDARTDHLPERCLPFEADYLPAPAFFAMREAYDGRAAS